MQSNQFCGSAVLQFLTACILHSKAYRFQPSSYSLKTSYLKLLTFGFYLVTVIHQSSNTNFIIIFILPSEILHL